MSKIAIATRADENNMKYYDMFKNSLRKFHTEDEVELLLWDKDKIDEYKDPIFFYRASPTIGKEIISKYDLILLMDCDQIIMGRLDHIFNMDADIGSVLNVNRIDPPKFGLITFQGVAPNEYLNNGLVAIKNNENGVKFINEWDRLCHTKYFHRLQYREQDILNILSHYGNYNVTCFDDYDFPKNSFTWNGLVAKGETMHAEFNGKDVIIPKGKDNYPDHDVVLKIIHWGGGMDGNKMNYRTCFQEPVIKYIDWLVGPNNNKYEKA